MGELHPNPVRLRDHASLSGLNQSATTDKNPSLDPIHR